MLTLFKNHQSRVFCVHPDSTRFSILDCSLITAPSMHIEWEIQDWKDQGFTHVSCEEFATALKKERK